MIMLLAKRPQEMFPTTLIDNFLNDEWVKSLYKKVATGPAINVMENDTEYELEIAVPGLSKEDLNVQIDENCLNVSMEKKTGSEQKCEKKNFLRREFSTQQFCRRFELPENVDKDKITAKVENGVLKIVLPKVITAVEKQQPKVITVG
ncbi:MAG: Hsp20/alpha crystallin family protein [Bacteroidales bacterium]|nr:Hsp20/alpha crystallin family protein [Bacteroidales bacterium]